jgi:hypothetical protein
MSRDLTRLLGSFLLLVGFSACDTGGPVSSKAPDTRDGAILVRSTQDLRRIGDEEAYPLTADYALAADLDAKGSEDWNGGDGFAPIGGPDRPFRGTFDGNGFVISGLSIDRPNTDSIGLFAATRGATLDSLVLRGIDVEGRALTGGLVGTSARTDLSNVRVDGRVAGTNRVGGLVGMQDGGTITTASANVSVSAAQGFSGGLVGENDGGTLRASVAAGTVDGSSFAGGLVGATENRSFVYPTILQCLARADVSGTTRVGGLAGSSRTTSISRSHASGTVKGTGRNVGGLLGAAGRGTLLLESSAEGTVTGESNTGGLAGTLANVPNDSLLVSESVATGDVRGRENVGGLVGSGTEARITESYAEGAVHGEAQVGGLVGTLSDGRLQDSYATGGVEGTEDVGGLVGRVTQFACVRTSYAAGPVSGTAAVGGIAGRADFNTEIESSYWDVRRPAPSTGVGTTAEATVDVEGLPTRDMQGTLAKENMSAFDFADTWRTTSDAYPTLREVLPNDDAPAHSGRALPALP